MADARIEVDSKMDTGDIDQGVDEIKKKLGSVEKEVGNFNEELKGMAVAAGAATAAAVSAFAVFGVKSAAELAAVDAQFEQVFGDLGPQAQGVLDSMGDSFGMLPGRLKPAMSQMTSMFKGLGLDTEDAMTVAGDAVTMAADAAAFYDKSFEDANSSLNSFIKGNYEGGESIGLFSKETQMAEWAAENLGLEWKNLDEAGKQVARLEFAKAMMEASGATGQAARESNSLENQLGNLKQAMKEFSAAVMEPALAPFVALLTKAAYALVDMADKARQLNAFLAENPQVIAAVGVAIGGLTLAILAYNRAMILNNAAKLLNSIKMIGGTVAAFFTSPITLAILALTAIGVAIALFSGHGDKMIAKLKSMGVPVDGLQKKLNELRSKLMTLFDSFKNSAIFETVSIQVERLKGAFQGVKDAISQAFSTGNFQPLLDMGMKLIPSLIMAIVGGLPQLLFTGTRILTTIAEGMGMTVPELISHVTTIITDMIVQFSIMMPQFINQGMQILLMLIQGITAQIPMIVESMSTVITTLVTAITLALPVIIAAGIQILSALIQGLIDTLPTLIDSALTILTSLTEAFITLLPMIIDAGIQILTALIDGLIQVLPALIEAGITLLTELLSTIIGYVPEILAAGIELIKALVEGVVDVLPDLVAAGITLLSELLATILDHLPELLSAGVELIQSLIDGALSLLSALVGAGGELILALLEKLGSYAGDMLTKGKELLTKVKDGIIQKKNDLVNGIGETIEAAKTEVTNFAGRFVEAGKDLIRGVAEGITSAAGEIATAAKNAAQRALDAALRLLGIHSPSRVMRDEVGKPIPQGIAAGIEKDEKTATQAMEDVLGSILSKKNEYMALLEKFDLAYTDEFDQFKQGGTEAFGSLAQVVGAFIESEGADVTDLAAVFGESWSKELADVILGFQDWNIETQKMTLDIDGMNRAYSDAMKVNRKETENTRSSLEQAYAKMRDYVLAHKDATLQAIDDIGYDYSYMFDELEAGGERSTAALIEAMTLMQDNGASMAQIADVFGEAWDRNIQQIAWDMSAWDMANQKTVFSIEDMSRAYNHMTQVASGATQTASTSAQKMVAEHSAAVDYMLSSMKVMIQANKDAFIREMDTMYGFGEDVWNNIVYGGSDAGGIIAQIIGKIMNMSDETQRSAQIAAIFGDTWNEAAVKTIQGFGAWKSEYNVGSWSLDQSKMLEHFKTIAKETGTETVAAAGEMKTAAEAAKKAVDAMTGPDGNLAKKALEEFKTSFIEYDAVFKDGMQKLLKHVDDNQNAMVESAIKNAKRMNDAYHEAMQNLGKTGSVGLQNIFDEFHHTFYELKDIVAVSLRAHVTPAFAQGLNNMIQTAISYASGFYNAGRSLADSFAAGLNSNGTLQVSLPSMSGIVQPNVIERASGYQSSGGSSGNNQTKNYYYNQTNNIETSETAQDVRASMQEMAWRTERDGKGLQ